MKEILAAAAPELGLELSGAALDRFEKYARFLAERNAVMDLTAIEGEENIARLHFLDCLALLGFADFKNARVVDVGSGAGFPGMVLKIAEPSMELTAVDSLKKRVVFLSELTALTELDGVSCLYLRAEEAPAELREGFDFAVSRAVAELRILCELALPFVKVGGMFIAMKGPRPEAETAAAMRAMETLGGEHISTKIYAVPGTEVRHSAVLIKKVRPTPEHYPRRFARIRKAPL